MNYAEIQKLNKKEQTELLFQEYGKHLFSYANFNWKISDDPAWELVYGTIYKIVEILPNFEYKSEGQFKSYIFKIFINRIKNHLRDEKIKRKDTVDVELKENYLANKEEQSDDNSLEMKALNSLLEKLDDWQRILLLMRAQNYSYAEIAKYVDRSEKNLKVYYGRLKKQLSKELELKLEKQESHGK